MHFAGLHRTPEITRSADLENGGMIFRLALHLPTENTDDVTGQSFTIGRLAEQPYATWPQFLSSSWPPECDAITSSFA